MVRMPIRALSAQQDDLCVFLRDDPDSVRHRFEIHRRGVRVHDVPNPYMVRWSWLRGRETMELYFGTPGIDVIRDLTMNPEYHLGAYGVTLEQTQTRLELADGWVFDGSSFGDLPMPEQAHYNWMMQLEPETPRAEFVFYPVTRAQHVIHELSSRLRVEPSLSGGWYLT